MKGEINRAQGSEMRGERNVCAGGRHEQTEWKTKLYIQRFRIKLQSPALFPLPLRTITAKYYNY